MDPTKTYSSRGDHKYDKIKIELKPPNQLAEISNIQENNTNTSVAKTYRHSILNSTEVSNFKKQLD